MQRLTEGTAQQQPHGATLASDGGFEQLGVPQPLAERARDLGAHTPAPVQFEAIPLLSSSKSVALRSAPGTGKTLAYVLPALSHAMHAHEDGPVRVLVVTPSRELASQVAGEARALLGPGSEPLVCLCSGGAGAQRQRERLRANSPPFVVGTPGRLAELSREGKLGLHHVSYLVIDEAESLLEAGDGLDGDVARLLTHSGRKLDQSKEVFTVVLAGAGLGEETVDTCEDWLGCRPRLVDGASTARVPPNVAHVCQPVLANWRKVEDMRRSINALNVRSAIVFVNGSRKVKDIAGKLDSPTVPVCMLHGLQKDQERKASIGQLKNGKARALVTTEVAAKGLDVPHCDAVFSFDVPMSEESYAHRAGRTGRFARGGYMVTLVERKRGEDRIVKKMASSLGVDLKQAVPKHGYMMSADEASTAVKDSEQDSEGRNGQFGGARSERTGKKQVNHRSKDRGSKNASSGGRSKKPNKAKRSNSGTSTTAVGAVREHR